MVYFIILLAIAAFLLWVSRKPDDFSVSRQININATPQDVFPWINNLKNMNQWNPWAGEDPKSTIAYEGPDEGAGAIYTWSGGKQGAGKFTILDVNYPNEVNCRLEMIKPFAADNKVRYSIRDDNGTTVVVWGMSGKNAFIHKLMQTFFSMDNMVGKEFEKGLSTLKQKVESRKLN